MDNSKEEFLINRTDTHMNSETRAAHTGPAHVQDRWGK